jgi:hypothetical protein
MSADRLRERSRLDPADGIALAAALLASCVVHSPALDSGFRYDDFLFFFQAANLPLVDFMFTPHAGHLLMMRNATFAAAFAAFELAPRPYFVLALLSHALNVALLFYVVRIFTGRTWAACLASALWGMAPIHQGTISWVSQYAGLVATTFILVVLADLARHAASERRPSIATGLFWAVMLVSAATSWGSGLVAALLLAPLAWLCMPDACGRWRTAALLAAGVPPVLVLFAAFSGSGPSGFGQSAAPVLTTLDAFARSLGYGVGAFWFGPWTTFGDDGVLMWPLAGAPLGSVVVRVCLASLPLFVLLGFAFWKADGSTRRRMLGFAGLAAGSYAAIAVARTGLALLFGGGAEFVAYAYRYHYFAMAPIAVCGALALVTLEDSLSARRGTRTAASARAMLVPVLLALAVITPFYKRAARHVDHGAIDLSRAKMQDSLANLDRALEKRVPGQPLYVENDPSRDLLLLNEFYPRLFFPGSVAIYTFARSQERDGLESVFFVERDVDLVKQLRANPRSRVSRLLVTPDEAAAAQAALPTGVVLDGGERPPEVRDAR